MQDTYQLPFRSCIQKAKASCLMCSYNAINGIPACADKNLLQKARTEWDFKGYITSDCDAVATIYEHHNYTKTPEDAVAIALKAGMDLNCGTYMLRYTQSAIDRRKVVEEDIDKALLNLFPVQFRLGLFNGDPIKGKFAVIGPMANATSELGGGYSGNPCSPTSILEGLKTYVKETSYSYGCLDLACTSKARFFEAVSISKEADFVIVVAGLDLTQEIEEHDRLSLLLPGYQKDLITSIAATSRKPIVLVLTGGGPVDVSFAQGDPQIASIIWVGYPGEAGGTALAEVIFGDHNPGGMLPVTWYPESFTSVPMTNMNMRSDLSNGYPGRTYRFYTEHCDSLRFQVDISVTNHGPFDGSTVVMLFSRVPAGFSNGAPLKQLVEFERVHTVSNSDARIGIIVDPCEHLSIVNEFGKKDIAYSRFDCGPHVGLVSRGHRFDPACRLYTNKDQPSIPRIIEVHWFRPALDSSGERPQLPTSVVSYRVSTRDTYYTFTVGRLSSTIWISPLLLLASIECDIVNSTQHHIDSSISREITLATFAQPTLLKTFYENNLNDSASVRLDPTWL
nr:probable beta-D-xylosidase 6 [Tanacetum cinerariifolium]